MCSIFDSSRSIALLTRSTMDPAGVSPGGGTAAMSVAVCFLGLGRVVRRALRAAIASFAA